MSGCKLTDDQNRALELLGSPARHIMLYGGARSGKTFLLVRALIVRALKHTSRHAVLRYRFNHVKASIIFDTLPKVMQLCWPDLIPHCNLDKSNWFYRLPNGSEIWFGGLDDKDRTEKILGQEYATLYLNECSQIPWSSRNMAITRLAQKTPLALKAYYDCNPPSEMHWTCRAFVYKLDPETRVPLRDKDSYAAMLLNPLGNSANLPSEYLQELQSLPERMRRRFWLGKFGDSTENALWTYELLDRCRKMDGDLPDMQRVLISVDPSGCSGEEDKRSDEVGIVVVGLGTDQRAYVLEDLSGRMGPTEWGRVVSDAFDRHEADAVVAETNFGGAMVGEVIRASRPGSSRRIPFREVHASRGKVVRAEPIAAIYEAGKVSHVGYFSEMEDQLCAMSTAGYAGGRSPDRADALVWGLSELFPGMTRVESKARQSLQTHANVGYERLKHRPAHNGYSHHQPSNPRQFTEQGDARRRN